MFDDSIDAWFMCITLLLPVGSVPRFLLCKEHIGKTSYLEIVFLHFCFVYYHYVLKKTTTTNLLTKSRVQTFSGSLSAAGLVCPQSGNQAIQSYFQCITAYRSYMYIITLPMCASTCHISLSVQTTSNLLKCSFVFGWVDEAVHNCYSHKDETTYY